MRWTLDVKQEGQNGDSSNRKGHGLDDKEDELNAAEIDNVRSSREDYLYMVAHALEDFMCNEACRDDSEYLIVSV